MRETEYSRVKKKQTALNLNVNKASRKFKEEKITVKSTKLKELTVKMKIVSTLLTRAVIGKVSPKSKPNINQVADTKLMRTTATIGIGGLESTDNAAVMRDSPTDMMKPIIE